jgi:hypothetical protein
MEIPDESVTRTDDVIGPMLSHTVTMHALKDKKGRLHFRDIERDE